MTPALVRTIATLLFPFSLPVAAADAAAGRALYQARCTACHSIDFNGVGPAHRGVFGRTAGQAKGFAYSEALARSGLVWTVETLDRWLADPEKLVPGQRMGVNVPDAGERAGLIAYLRSVSEGEAAARR